ncbi:hypothetical protein ACJIZ3_014214 [Penstemon smallii]|uniref:Uncharacterized protein n=1 Tax=Penstemon smallii TaxID=265156 RepID=A0ABD3RM76_9LAMI
MTSKADIVRIGKEGFALVDEYIAIKGRPSAPRKPYVSREAYNSCIYKYKPQQTNLYQVDARELMNTYEVVQFKDGVSTMDYFKKKSANMAY